MHGNQDIARSHLQRCRGEVFAHLESKSLCFRFPEFRFVGFFRPIAFLGEGKSGEQYDRKGHSGDGRCRFRQRENKTTVIRPKPTGISVPRICKLNGTLQRSACGSLNRSTKTARAFIAKLQATPKAYASPSR